MSKRWVYRLSSVGRDIYLGNEETKDGRGLSKREADLLDVLASALGEMSEGAVVSEIEGRRGGKETEGTWSTKVSLISSVRHLLDRLERQHLVVSFPEDPTETPVSVDKSWTGLHTDEADWAWMRGVESRVDTRQRQRSRYNSKSQLRRVR